MLKKFRIDELIVFFIMSLGFLLVSWWSGVFNFSEEHPEIYPQELSLEHNLEVHSSDGGIDNFQLYNPNYEIFYSVDGGDHYINAGNSLEMEDVTMVNIDHYPSSLRWRPSASKKEIIKTIQLFVLDPVRKIRSESKVYILDPEQREGKSIYLNTSQKGLFDDKDGLLVGGEYSWSDNTFYKSWYYRNANYTQRGMVWERRVNIQLVENGEVVFDQDGGLRISGNATRGFNQKSFRIKARQQYGEPKFSYGFFGKPGLKKYESLVIRQSGNDNTETMFADLLMHRLAEGSKVLIQKGEPLTVYINGNYWGQYNLRERIDKYFVAKNADCKSKDVTIIEGGDGVLKSGDENERQQFINEINNWLDTDKMNKDINNEIKSKVSIKSFMDYLFFETYYANNDWIQNNVLIYKTPGKKWKFILNDLDYSLAYPGASNVKYNAFPILRSSQTVVGKLFQILVKDAEFKERFVERSRRNIEKYLSKEKVETEFYSLKGQYEPFIQDQIDRWRVIESKQAWEQNCQRNLDFLLNRKKEYLKQLEDL